MKGFEANSEAPAGAKGTSSPASVLHVPAPESLQQPDQSVQKSEDDLQPSPVHKRAKLDPDTHAPLSDGQVAAPSVTDQQAVTTEASASPLSCAMVCIDAFAARTSPGTYHVH